MFTAQTMHKLLLVFIYLFSSSNICLVHLETTDTWGNLYNVRVIDQKTAIASSFVFKVQNLTLKFPVVIMKITKKKKKE